MMKIKKDVFKKIASTVGTAKPETGGALGIKNGVVCEFYFDENSTRYDGEYSPNTDDINSKLIEWSKRDIDFAGIIHSHPNGVLELSDGDRAGIELIARAIPSFDALFFPIVVNYKNEFQMTVYRVTFSTDGVKIENVDYEILE